MQLSMKGKTVLSNPTQAESAALTDLMARRQAASADGDQFLADALSIAWCAVYEQSFGTPMEGTESIAGRAKWMVRGVELDSVTVT